MLPEALRTAHDLPDAHAVHVPLVQRENQIQKRAVLLQIRDHTQHLTGLLYTLLRPRLPDIFVDRSRRADADEDRLDAVLQAEQGGANQPVRVGELAFRIAAHPGAGILKRLVFESGKQILEMADQKLHRHLLSSMAFWTIF